jgi:hypothetical protein
MTRHFTATIALLSLMQSGCNRDPLPGSEDDQSIPDLPDPTPDLPGDGDGDDDEPGDGDDTPGDGDGDPACAENQIECDGVCVNPNSDTNNCGQCGRTCWEGQMDLLEGGCFQGECRPHYSECFTQADGFTTCAEVCASKGQTCRDKDDLLRCGNVARAWHDPDEFEICEAHLDGVGLNNLENCESPLPFDNYAYITCCCTQTAQLP